jgi:lysophospholipase L1-like esterase
MRQLLAAAATVVLASVALAEPAHAQEYPDSMASTGDSITRAFNAGLIPWTDAPRQSWSTGSSTYVSSHYRRILAANPAILGRNFNDARSGARMADLERQMQVVNTQAVDYVTVLIGANDACASSEAAMTPVAAFGRQFEQALTTLGAGSPQTLVYVVSIPDVYRLWQVLHRNPLARLTWRLTGFCRSMLANPGSTAPADMARRQRVRQRIVEYNSTLAGVCARYIRCRFDGNAVFEYPFQPRHVSTRDYFHPSREGQRVLAHVSWEAGYDFGTSATSSPPSSS